MATTKLCKLYYGTNLSTLNFRHTATDSANLAYTIKDTETSTDLVSGTISHDTLTDLVPIMWVNSAVNGTEYDLYVDDTVAVINLSCSSIENENISSYVEFYPTNPVMIGLTTFICNHNHLLTTGLTFPSFTNALNLVNINNNQLTSETLDALILKVWSNAITNLQLSKAFNVSNNAGTPSAQSTAYLTALNDNRSFKWTVNGVAPAGSGTVHVKTAADLQTLAVNLAADAVLDNNVNCIETRTWGVALCSAGVPFSDGNYYFWKDVDAETYAAHRLKWATTVSLINANDSTVVGFIDNVRCVLYKSTADIPSGITGYTYATKGFMPISTFIGTFNGSGYTLNNLFICRPNIAEVAIFGNTTGNIANTKANSCLVVGITGGTGEQGIIKGDGSGNVNKCIVSNSSVYGGITAPVCSFNRGIISQCYSNNNYIYGTYAASAICAQSVAIGRVNNCYEYDNVIIGTSFLGAICASRSTGNPVIINCFSYSGYKAIGRVELVAVGVYDKAIGSDANLYKVISLTAAQFKDKANFATVTANYTGLAGITTHVTTNQYLAYTIVYNSTRTALYICNTAITTGTVALTDERWQELVFNEIEQVIFTDYLYTEDETGLVIKARETGSEDWITISVHNPTYRTYANTERVITADGKCYVALQNVPLGTAITNTEFWYQDTGYNFIDTWRMMWEYPKLKTFQLQPVVLQQYLNGDN